MSGGPLAGALVENASLKLAALAISVVLFAVVRGDREAVTAVHAKVVYLYPADRVLMIDPVAELRITVRGPGNRLGHLDEHDLEAVRVDLRDARDGELRFGEEMVRLPPGLRVEAISPPSIQLRFEARVEREVPIQPVLIGQPAPGFRVVRATCDPRTVVVAGPSSLVSQILHVPTRPLHVSDTREPVRGEVDLSPAPPHIEWRREGPVSVAVEVGPALPDLLSRPPPGGRVR